MSTIAAPGSSARDDLAALLRSGKSSPLPSTHTKGTNAASDKSVGPAAIVDLSDRAKAMLERNEADQVVADRLQEQLAANSKGKNAPDRKSAASLLETAPTTLMKDGFKSVDFNTIEAQERRMANGEALQLGQDNMSADEAFADGFMRSMARTIMTLEDNGKPAEASQLRSALQNGTLKVQPASEVDGLNYTYEKTATGERGSTDWSGASEQVKAMLNTGHAMTYATPGQGAFFVSW